MSFIEEIKALGLTAIQNYVTPVRPAKYPIEGRDIEMRSLIATFSRQMITNAILLGEPGTGKTAIVQGLAANDKRHLYLEVNLALMAAGTNGTNEMALRLKQLFDEVEKYREIKLAQGDVYKDIVLFIDEFHRIRDFSEQASEEIKPALAESGERGIRILAATTFEEYDEKIAGNKALNDRLQKIKIRELPKEQVLKILKNFAKKNLDEDTYYAIDPKLYDLVYEYANRYNPSSPQPRKSLFLLDDMLGYHNAFRLPLDEQLLAVVLYYGIGVNVQFRADAKGIKERLDKRVFAQGYATSVIAKRLQICIGNLNDPTRPMGSFLFTGSTGVGKTELAKGMSALLFGDERAMLRYDMSEFATIDTIGNFRESLARAITDKPYAVVLLDEIEKAHAAVTRLLLQVFDDGRLSDRYGREVSFKNAYIILTTNVGSEIYKDIANYSSSDTGDGGLSEYDKVIRTSLIESNTFPPELINRMDAIVPFQPLSQETLKRITAVRLLELKNRVFEQHGVELGLDSTLVDYLSIDRYDTDTNSGGARGIMHQIEIEVVPKIAEVINEDSRVRQLVVRVEGDMAAHDKFRRVSQASVVVQKVSSVSR